MKRIIFDTSNAFVKVSEFAKKNLKYNLPHIINGTPEIVVEKIYTHSLRGFTTYAKQFLIQKYTDTCAIPNCYSCNQYHH